MKVSESVANRVRNINSSETMITQTPTTQTHIKESHVKLNKFFQYYAPVSYVLYFLLVASAFNTGLLQSPTQYREYGWFYFNQPIYFVYAVIYLTFTFQNQSDLKLYINYKPVVEYQSYNSYSLLTPILSIIVAVVLAYTTRSKLELSDGDFFGILGVILFLACVTLHDGIGINRLYWDEYTNATNIANTSSVQGIAWDKAWSTRPDCFKHAAEKEVLPPLFSDVIFNVREKNWVLKENYSDSVTNDTSQMSSNDDNATQQKDKNTDTQQEDKKNDAVIPETMTDQGEGQRSFEDDEGGETVDDEIFVADRISARHTITVHQMCDGFNSKFPVDKPRVWMKVIQNQLHCCGPRNDKQNWSLLVKNIQCDQKLQGCAGPFIEFLKKVFFQTYVVMHVETALLVLTMIMYSFHFVAMKKQQVEVIREYSLLRVTSQTSLKEDEYNKHHHHDLDRSYSHHNKHHHRHHHHHSIYYDRRSRGHTKTGLRKQSLVEKNQPIQDTPRTDVIFDLPEDEYAQQKGQKVSTGTKSQPRRSSLKKVDIQPPPAAAIVEIASNSDNHPVQNEANAEPPKTERFLTKWFGF